MFPQKRIALSLCLLVFIIAATRTATSQDKPKIDWQEGPCVGVLGDVGQISVPKGYRFSGKDGAQRVLELTKNPVDGGELGVVVPDVDNDNDFWYAIFDFADVGYVKDTEKDKLDKDAILDSIQKATEDSNKTRESRGWPAFHVSGWVDDPFYSPVTNNLTWAVSGYSQDQKTGREQAINYSVRVLGRQGTMNVDLVILPNQLSKAVPEFESLLHGFSFLPGKRYADFRPGDQIAKYGLTGLILGGAVVAAAKTGLLAKFWKILVIIAAAILSAIKKFFRYLRRLITGKASEEQQESAK